MGKVNTVLQSVHGSEFEQNQITYKAHNPPRDSTKHTENTEHFLTLVADGHDDAVKTLSFLLSKLRNEDGIVIEAERVLGFISAAINRWAGVLYDLESSISAADVHFDTEDTAPIEIHHCFDIPKDATVPLNIADLCADLESYGLHVGTWSLFFRHDVWSFRSTAFVGPFSYEDRARKDFAILLSYLNNKKLPYCDAWLVAEQILGIWQTPLTPSTPSTEQRALTNQVTVTSLVGASDSSLPHFSRIVEDCLTKETRDVSERDAKERQAIEDSVTSFKDIIEAQTFEPVLIELAVIDDVRLHSKPQRQGAHGSNRYFVANMISYLDTPGSIVLDAWQQATDHIVNEPRHIDPIVSHPATYRTGYLYQSLSWLVEQAYAAQQIPSRDGPKPVQSAREVLARAIVGYHWMSKVAACRKNYLFESADEPAPVHVTMKKLSDGFILELMKRLASGALLPSDTAAISQVLLKLSRSFLIVVPFRWQVTVIPPRRESAEALTVEEPGGCLFAVVSPRREEVPDATELGNVAIRLSWMLFRAALEEVHRHGHVPGRETDNSDIKERAVAFADNLNAGLKGIEGIPSVAEKLDHILKHVHNMTPKTMELLKRGLSGDTFNRELLWEDAILAQHKLTRSTFFRWKKRLRGTE